MAITSSGYTTNRITGMYSGMDTASLVTSMLSSYQSRLDKTFQQKEKAQWKYDAYTSLNSTVSTLRNDYLSVLGSKTVMSSKAYNQFTVNMESNAAIKLTAKETASNTSFSILSTTMAKAASATSSVNSQQTQATGAKAKYMQAQISSGIMDGVTEESTLKELGWLDGEGKLSFTINGETFSFEEKITEDGRATTLQDVMDAVNDTSKIAGGTEEADVTMSLKDGVLTLAANKMGEESAIEVSNVSGNLFGEGKVLGLNASMVDTLNIKDAKFELPEGSDGKFTINGEEFSVFNEDGEEKTIEQVMNEVNSREGLGVKMNYENGTFSICNTAESGAKEIQLEGAIFGEDGTMGIREGKHSSSAAVRRSDTLAEVANKLGTSMGSSVTFNINGKDFEFKSTDKLSDVMSKIESADIGARFTFSEMTDSFKLESTETGADSTLSVSGMEIFGIKSGDYDNGSNATLKFMQDGKEYTISQEDNEFTLDGLTFEITSDKTFEGSGLSVSVEQDYQATIDSVKAFIEDYNKMIGELNSKYYEDVHRGYDPLTTEQRSELTEKEAELWDEKAKSGILKNDALIGNLLTNLRSGLFAKVGDTGMSAYDIGIKTVSWNSDWKNSQGKLELDEDKLLAALKKDPDAVMKVLTQVSTNNDGSANTAVSGSDISAKSESGLFVRMNSLLSGFNTTMRSQYSVIQNNINNYSSKMDDILDKMSEKEERYYQQYAAMEDALAQLQSQSNYFAGMLGMGTSTGA